MRIPILRGLIDRRLLVNYRVDPDVLARILPPPFEPKLIHGHAMVGICLIRLKHVRPRFVPAWLGIGSENAAHRAAVQWYDGGELKEGVFVRRRDTDSRLNACAGGRLFPGLQHHARFDVTEAAEHLSVALQSDDGETHVAVRGRVSAQWPTSSVFGSLAEASAFFQTGSLGYSLTPQHGVYQGMELRCQTWDVQPLEIDQAASSYYDDPKVFPKGSIEYDCTLLMRGIQHEWHGQSDLCCTVSPVTAVAEGLA
jgi:uncharacterized protein YqjF (DUF2071 family)